MKSMKKSMLVTTILMVVLLIVALSTATFAWYTAQSSVTVTKTELTSAESGSASLAIDKSANTGSTNSSVTITMKSGSEAVINPMVPSAKPTKDTTLYNDFIAGFKSQSISNSNLFLGDGATATPATINGVTAGDNAGTNETAFWVINTNKDNAKENLKATVSIAEEGYALATITAENFDENKANLYTKSGLDYTKLATDATYDSDTPYYKANADIAKFVRIAMFVGDGTDANSKYVGTWSRADQTTYYGTITNGAHGTNSLSSDYETTASGGNVILSTSLPASSAVEIRLVAWFDGPSLGTANAGAAATFTITFD